MPPINKKKKATPFHELWTQMVNHFNHSNLATLSHVAVFWCGTSASIATIVGVEKPHLSVINLYLQN